MEGETERCSGPMDSCCLKLKSINVVKISPNSLNFLFAPFSALSFTLSHPRIINREVYWACLGESRM